MKVFVAILFGLLAVKAQAVCMQETSARLYGCLPMEDNTAAQNWCKERHGKSYKAYLTDNVCSKELAASLRGESYVPSTADKNLVVEAACMTYEQGMKAGCDYYDYLPAQRFCAENFGNRYIPFVPDKKNCSLSAAARSRGEVAPKKLVEGLASSMDEIESIITMIDREGVGESLGGGNGRPAIGNEFYNDVVKALMAKMSSFKDRLRANGRLNIPLQNEYVLDYLRFAFRYLNVLGRLYKVYAYVGHQNHYALGTYTYENLEYLNLILKKEHALEILAQVNFRAQTLEGGEEMEFFVGQQERQTYEFLAMQEPETKVDYAKLVAFMGVRENLTNLWGVQRMTPYKIPNGASRSCGQFLSFRPGPRGNMEASAAYQELFEYDVFYNDYAPRWEELIERSQSVSILNAQNATDMGVYLMGEVPALRKLLAQSSLALEAPEDFRAQAAQDAAMLIEAENSYWREFSDYYFSTVVMPGDGALDQNAVVNRIVEEAYLKRMQAIADVYIASYLWVSDEGVEEIETALFQYADRRLKDAFISRLKSALAPALRDYNSRARLARINRSDKEDETFAAAEKAALAARTLDALDEKSFNFRWSPTVEPATPQELAMLFQDRLEKRFYDVYVTLERNEEFALELSEFFREIHDEFERRFPEADREAGVMGNPNSPQAKELRSIAFEAAKKRFALYPYLISSHKLRYPPVVVGNSEHSIPVYIDGSPAAISKEEFMANLPRQRNNYVERGNNPAIFFGAIGPSTGTRNNPDKLTIGVIGAPLEVVSPGRIRSTRGEDRYNHAQLGGLLERFGVYSAKVAQQLKQAQVPVATNPAEAKLEIKSPEKFWFRVFESLRLQDVGMRQSAGGRFADDKESQIFLANNLASQAYQVASLLRNEQTWKKRIEQTCYSSFGMSYDCSRQKEVQEPLLKRIASEAFDSKTGEVNENRARSYIAQAIDSAIQNTPNQLEKFCNVNYLNYKNDPNFKEVYKASNFLRATLRAGVGQSQSSMDKIAKLDEGVRKDIRGFWESWNEDFFEPSLMIMGAAAVVALGVILVVGSGGVAAPGVMGGLYAAASTFLAVEFFVSFPLVVGSLYSRINTHFIEVPAQLQFQQALATSQIEGKIVDWDMLDDEQASNKSGKLWTIGLMPLDFLYGAMLVRHVRKETGVVGRAAYQRLTGAKLRGWSAPPKSMLNNPRFSELRRSLGTRQAIQATIGAGLSRARSFLPKYQPIPENMIRSFPLRAGMARQARALNIHHNPGAILADIQTHAQSLRARLTSFSEYVAAEGKLVEKVRLRGSLQPNELVRHFKESSFYFLPANLVKKIKARDAGAVARYFTNFGEVWDQLKLVQGETLLNRAKQLESVADKLSDFQRGVARGHYPKENGMERFLEHLSDAEILSLEEVAKKSQGVFKQFRSVFKDYQRVLEGIRPMSYLNAYGGRSFGAPAYGQTYNLDGSYDLKQAFDSDARDLLNFYESMMRHHGNESDAFRRWRGTIEESLARELRDV